MKSEEFLKSMKTLILFAIICVTISISPQKSFAQEIEVTLKMISPARLRVEGKFLQTNSPLASKDISFLQSYADVSGLGERIESFAVYDEKGKSLEVKKMMAGEFQTDEIPQSWQYEVKTEVSKRLTDSAHISWLSNDLGLLMLGDLLPHFKSSKPISAKVKIDFPNNWRIATSETQQSDKVFNVKDLEKAVFLIGKNFREKSIQLDKATISFVFAGDWKFSDDEAVEMARSILVEHKNLFKEIPTQKTQIILMPFPQENSNAERWRAETRGSTVTIISGVLPFKSQAIQRLHEQLRHEIFHLWLPNGLALSGNYDWFYEGFTIYHALRTGVELNQIRFDDFLNTLSRAYDMAKIMSESQSFSLIEASNKRWQGASNLIYAKGLVVAFLCDVALLSENKGKRNLKDIFRQVYQKYRFPNEIQDGSAAITSILKSFPQLNLIVQNYVEGKKMITWENDLNAVGLENNKDNFGSQLKVLANLNGRQKDLLDKLGYNQWRKLGQKTK